MSDQTVDDRPARASFSQFHANEIKSGLESVRTALMLQEIKAKQLNMSCVLHENSSCGTVGCIGGWLGTFLGLDEYKAVQAVFGVEIFSISGDTHDLHNLLFNFPTGPRHRNLLPFEAIEAINAWLGGNKTDPWATVRKRLDGADASEQLYEELLVLERAPLIPSAQEGK